MTTHFVNLLDELRRRSLRMASAVEDVLQEACDAAVHGNLSLARRVIDRDNEIDEEEIAVEREVIRLMALFQPMGSDMRMLCTVLKVNSDLERAADCAVNIAERALHLDPDERPGNDPDLKTMASIVRRILRHAIQAYANGDADSARGVVSEDDAIDAAYRQFIRRIMAEASGSPEEMPKHWDLLSIAKNLERIADHATNIAEDVIFMATGSIVRHSDG
jgi:phosphate transport system protein